MTTLPTPTEWAATGDADKTIVQRLHESAIAAYQAACRVDNADLFEAAMLTAHQATIARVVELTADHDKASGQTVDTIDGPLTIAYAAPAFDDDGNHVTFVVMSADGMHVERSGWHRGPDADDVDRWVRYEAWWLSEDGRLVERRHGYCHQVSRRITQVG